MIHKLSITCILLLIVTQSFAISDQWQIGGRSSAMAGANLFNADVWSSFNNPASMVNTSNFSTGIFYENSFITPELSTTGFAFIAPVNEARFGINYLRSGYSLYNENKIGISYAMPLAKWLSMGIQIDLLNQNQSSYYGNINTLTFDIGILAEPTENLFFAAHIFNPANIKLNGELNEDLKPVLRFGAGYRFAENLMSSIEAESDGDTYTTFKLGLEYRLLKDIILMAGINSQPVKNSIRISI